MKKLLYTLLAVSLVFSACEEEVVAPNTNNNNNNSALAIGDSHQGGIIFYLDANGGGLIAAPSDQGQALWGCWKTLIGANGTAIGTGAQNTIDIEAGCNESGTAADICANLTLGGFSDWFLPSIDELNEMYVNLHQQGFGSFANDITTPYWSSTEYNSEHAWRFWFNNGDPGGWGYREFEIHYVRAVRAF
tara:strand:- start:199 stop:768 length:570 start_codon:yes stop_codon:yes gene_type:complete